MGKDKAMMTQVHVDYEKPPVIEVACGVQFKDLKQLTVPLIGLFWTPYAEEYPTTNTVRPLPHTIEGTSARRGSPRLRFTQTQLPRTLFIHHSQNWVMQIQSDWFFHNWRREVEEEYPRFPGVYQRFKNKWSKFSEFCINRAGERPEVDQFELTYVNHIPSGEGWQDLSDIGDVFPDLAWRKEREFLPSPENCTLNLSFRLPCGQSYLHVSISPGFNQETKQGVLLCELTARGMSSEEGMDEWFELSREWVVKGFSDLSASLIQDKYWKRKK